MKRILVAAMIAFPLAAQEAGHLGADVFRKSCAVGYCHGSGGTQGRAPKMIGRNFDPDYVRKVTRDGIPNTGMPGWKDRLSPAEFEAVIDYVIRISGSSPSASAAAGGIAPEAAPPPPEAQQGRSLFFDAVRGVRCGTCHSLEGIGTAVGPNLAALPAGQELNFRRERAVSVRRARTSDGDSFPALVVEEKNGFVRLYDLSVPPPVLRTLPAGTIKWSAEREWNHAKAVAHYSDEELQSVRAYLRWLADR